MSFLSSCCCCNVQEGLRNSGDLAPSTPLFNDDLRFDGGILHDCRDEGSKYAELLQSGDIPEVEIIEFVKLPAECKFMDILSRHKDTIQSMTLDCLESSGCDSGKQNFHRDMLGLILSLRGLLRLSFLKIHAYQGSVFPKEFLEGLPHLASLRCLSLIGTLAFGMLPLQCEFLEHLTISEAHCTEVGCPVDLSKLCLLKTLSVSAKRTLILPAQSPNMFALNVRSVTSLENVKFSKLTVLRISNCVATVAEQLLADRNTESLRELIIESEDRLELNREIDARKLEILYLSNVALEYIDTSEETPVKSMCLANSTITTSTSGMLLHAISVYVSYNDIRHINNLCLNGDILKRLALGREHQSVRETTGLDRCAMQAVNRIIENLDLLATFAPITNFPEMPHLKYLALYSDAECKRAFGKVPELIELTRSVFWQENISETSTDTVTIPQVPSMKYCFDTFRYWSSHNEYTPYTFLY